jgi:hypothetical protein
LTISQRRQAAKFFSVFSLKLCDFATLRDFYFPTTLGLDPKPYANKLLVLNKILLEKTKDQIQKLLGSNF